MLMMMTDDIHPLLLHSFQFTSILLHSPPSPPCPPPSHNLIFPPILTSISIFTFNFTAKIFDICQRHNVKICYSRASPQGFPCAVELTGRLEDLKKKDTILQKKDKKQHEKIEIDKKNEKNERYQSNQTAKEVGNERRNGYVKIDTQKNEQNGYSVDIESVPDRVTVSGISYDKINSRDLGARDDGGEGGGDGEKEGNEDNEDGGDGGEGGDDEECEEYEGVFDECFVKENIHLSDSLDDGLEW